MHNFIITLTSIVWLTACGDKDEDTASAEEVEESVDTAESEDTSESEDSGEDAE